MLNDANFEEHTQGYVPATTAAVTVTQKCIEVFNTLDDALNTMS